MLNERALSRHARQHRRPSGVPCTCTAFAGVRTLRSPAMVHDAQFNRYVAWIDLDNHLRRLSTTISGGFSITSRPGSPFGSFYVWFHGPENLLHRAFSEGYKPIGLYSIAWSIQETSGVGATYNGDGHDTYAYFDLNGRLNINVQ